MITNEDFYALLRSLDLQHVHRIILVGDPNQLPPIGAGRPFADLIGMLRQCQESESDLEKARGAALAELQTEVRTVAGQQSDALRLATLFASGEMTVDADRIFNDLENGSSLNDIDVCYWRTAEELRDSLIRKFKTHLGLKGKSDVEGIQPFLRVRGKRPDFVRSVRWR
jgi:hypothetical protein